MWFDIKVETVSGGIVHCLQSPKEVHFLCTIAGVKYSYKGGEGNSAEV